MNNYLTTGIELTSIANAIHTVGGTSASLIYPSGFISAIQEIQPSLESLTINENRRLNVW